MEMPRLSKSVKKAIRLEKGPSGEYKAVTIYESPEPKKKKGFTGFRILDKSLRRSIGAQKAFLDRYLSLHEQSNHKEKDGWVMDLAPNMMKSGRTFVKKLKIEQLPTP